MQQNLVVQANELIEARYKQTYTVQELRTILWVISEIHKENFFNPKNYKHGYIAISIKKYAEVLGINEKNMSRDAEKIASNLGSKRFTLKTSTGWINLGWISSMEYNKPEGEIRVLVAPDLIPFIIALKQYTAFRLENILSISSSHAIKIYQLLSQYKTMGERTIGLNELRLMLGISEIKSYESYKSIKQRILDISEREINEKTDLYIKYIGLKKGRKVDSVKFYISIKSKINNKTEHLKLNQTKNINLSTSTIEEAKMIVQQAHYQWDLYAIIEQFYEFIEKKGKPNYLKAAFLAFVRKKVSTKP